MSELSKLFSSAMLLAVGFFGASLFGPPELTQRLLGQWAAPSVDSNQGLQPIAGGSVIAPLAPFPVSEADRSATAIASSASHHVVEKPTGGAWEMPNFGAAATDPIAATSPTADFNQWLGAAGNWLDGQAPAARRDEAVRPASGISEAEPAAVASLGSVEWLPPRRAARSPSSPVGAVAREPAPIATATVSPPASVTAGVPAIPSVSREPQAVRSPAEDPWSPFAAWGDASHSLSDWPTGAELAAAPVARPRPTGFRTHVVTDGDTLPLLAERYLGDAGRSAELFDLNRELLDSPELLPIGVVLRLPPATRRPPARARAAAPIAPSDSSPSAYATVSSGGGFTIPSVGDGADVGRLVPVGDPEDAAPRVPETTFLHDLSW